MDGADRCGARYKSYNPVATYPCAYACPPREPLPCRPLAVPPDLPIPPPPDMPPLRAVSACARRPNRSRFTIYAVALPVT